MTRGPVGNPLNVVDTIPQPVPLTHQPDLVQAVRSFLAFVKRTVDGAGQPVANLLVQQPDLGALVTAAANIADAARIFQDPDLVAGYDNVNDPDLIQPLGVVPEVVPMASVPDDGITQGGAATPHVNLVGGLIGQADKESGGGGNCKPIHTTHTPATHDSPQPVVGVDITVTATLSWCNNEANDQRDYYAVAWDGWATPYDTSSPKRHYTLTRFKFRTNLDVKYYRDGVDPSGDVKLDNGKQVTWLVGFDKDVLGSISGTFTYVNAKKIHPWVDDKDVLSHVSWIASSKLGNSGQHYHDGGGVTFDVPQDTGNKAVIASFDQGGWGSPGGGSLLIEVYKCQDPNTSRQTCTPYPGDKP